ncbi:hypothetical protein C2W62_26680 [Candidatus Entotheonella serta]|nr:hypothetical protein C2W62_26680 [Candidatus Entotheonella serta]
MTFTQNLAVLMSPTLRWETFFSAILRDGGQPDTCNLTDISSVDFLAACTAHGVAPLIHRELHQRGALASWPAALQTALINQVYLHAAMDALREQELRTVLDAFAHCGVQPLLMKGTPLAYTHYAASDLRPRSDTDMLIARADCEAAHQALIDLRYTPSNAVSGELIMHQRLYTKTDAHGVNHLYDLHWKVSNPLRFADLLNFPELAAEAVPIPALGPHAHTLKPVHALLLACIHRVAHHHNSHCLIWLYDIHLLASRLTPDEWETCLQLARYKQVCAVCHDGLQLAKAYFDTSVPSGWLATDPQRDDVPVGNRGHGAFPTPISTTMAGFGFRLARVDELAR